MNYKFLGNSIDLMKWYLLSAHISTDGPALYYVPMITEPKPRSYDPKLMVNEIGAEYTYLYNLMQQFFESEQELDPGCIREFFDTSGRDIKIFSRMRASKSYFTDAERKTYFTRALDMFQKMKQHMVVYIDPDVGVDLNLKRRFRSNKEMYIQSEELRSFKELLTPGDALVCFQHLGNSSYKLEDRLSDLKQAFGPCVFIAGYTRIQGSFIHIFCSEDDYGQYYERTKQRFDQYQDFKHFDKLFIQ